MSDKLFKTLMYMALALGVLSVALLLAYTIYLQGNASILSYIGNERFW